MTFRIRGRRRRPYVIKAVKTSSYKSSKFSQSKKTILNKPFVTKKHLADGCFKKTKNLNLDLSRTDRISSFFLFYFISVYRKFWKFGLLKFLFHVLGSNIGTSNQKQIFVAEIFSASFLTSIDFYRVYIFFTKREVLYSKEKRALFGFPILSI